MDADTLPTLFVVHNCGACRRAMVEVTKVLLKQGRTVIIRMPSPDERKLLPDAYPILHLPKEIDVPPVLLVGGDIAKVIEAQPGLAGHNVQLPMTPA